MKRQDWPDLLVFLAIAETRSFAKAAARLEVSKSAVSHALKALETRLGVRLLNRTSTSVAPTEEGESLLVVIKPAIEDVTSIVDNLATLNTHPRGVVRISVSHESAQSWIVPWMASFATQYPDVAVHLAADDDSANVANGVVDAVLRRGRSLDHDIVSVRASPDTRTVVCGAPGYLASVPASWPPTPC